MGLFSGLGSFFGPIGTLVGGAFDSASSENSAQSAADQQMANTRTLRQTAYQDTTQDLKASGLNPMLAYSNGATAAANPPLVNKGLQGAQQNSAGALTENTRADTVNKEASTAQINAQTRLIEAQTQNTMTGTGKITQETANLQQDIARILAQTENLHTNSRLQVDQAELARQQTALTKTQERLTNKTIDLQTAQKELAEIQKKLQELGVPAAKNAADFETRMGETLKAGGAAGKVLGTIINGARAIR